MLIQFSSGFLVRNFFTVIRELVQVHEGDGFLLYWAKEILAASIIFALFWTLSRLLVMVLNTWGKRLTAFTATELDDRLLQRIIPHISRLLIAAGFYLAIRSLPLHESLVQIASGVIYIVLVVIVCNIIFHAVDELIKWYLAGQQSTGAVISRQMMPVVEKVVLLVLIGSALLVVLRHFNYDIFSLVTALGIGSLAIGMAAKDTLAHMISGFTIMIDRPFRIGDRIQLAGGQLGDVSDIGLRSTKIKTLDNQLLIIPNSDLCNTMLTNQAFPDNRVKGRINVSVAYGSDIDKVKAVLLDAAKIDDVLTTPEPEAFLTGFGESSLNMALFFWIENYVSLIAVTDKINSQILNKFSENAIEIPFPTRTVNMHKGTVCHGKQD